MIRYNELSKRVKLDGLNKTTAHLTECLGNKTLKPRDFSLQSLFETLVVDANGESCGRYLLAENGCADRQLTEGTDGVDITAFANITGQLLVTTVMDAYQSEEFILSKMVPSTSTKSFVGEKIPGVSRIKGDGAKVHPGMPYPRVGFGEDWVEFPKTDKYGEIIPVTKEAIIGDLTGLVLDTAQSIGEDLGFHKEERLLDVLIGSTNNYSWKGTSYNTYQTSTPWVNVKSSNELVDWTDVNESEQLFAAMLDPNTARPILIDPKFVLVTPAYLHSAARIFNATSVEHVDNSASAGTVRTNYSNPLTGYSFGSSKLMYRRIVAGGADATAGKKWWFHGDFARALTYRENWPITVQQAPVDSHDSFDRDIVVQWKASESGVAAVKNPRYVVKNYDS